MKRFFAVSLILLSLVMVLPCQGAVTLPTKVQDIVLSKGPWVDSRAYSTLTAADAAALAVGRELLITTNHIVSSATVLLSHVRVAPGGKFTKSNNGSLAIPNGFYCPNNYQCFYGFSAGEITRLGVARPEWWGSGSSSVQAAFDSATGVTYGCNVIDTPETNKISITDGVVYAYSAGAWDDHVRKSVDGLFLVGDGTQTILDLKGSYSSVKNSTFISGDVGLVRKSYATDGYKNHYKSNRIGLQLDGTTSHSESGMYARGNTEAAVLIGNLSGISEVEDTQITTSVIEGNRGCAIKAQNITGSFRLILNDVYLELNGDAAVGTPSVDIPKTDGFSLVRIIGGKLSYNIINGWTSGDYKWGDNVVYDGSRVSGYQHATNASIINGTKIASATFNDGEELINLVAWNGVRFDGGFNQTGGYLFSTSPAGRIGVKGIGGIDIAPTAYPYATAATTNPPSISEDTASDYGDGSWVKVIFNPIAGTASTSNYVRVGSFFSGTTQVVVYSFLIKSDTDTVVGINETGASGRISSGLGRQLVAGKTYKVIALGNKTVTGNNAIRVYPMGVDGPTVYIKPLHQIAFNTGVDASAFISKLVGSAPSRDSAPLYGTGL